MKNVYIKKENELLPVPVPQYLDIIFRYCKDEGIRMTRNNLAELFDFVVNDKTPDPEQVSDPDVWALYVSIRTEVQQSRQIEKSETLDADVKNTLVIPEELKNDRLKPILIREEIVASLDIAGAQKRLLAVPGKIFNESKQLVGDIFSFNGKWFVLQNPPTKIDKPLGIISEILMRMEESRIRYQESRWLLGNFVAECRDFYGDEFDISLICEANSLAQRTVEKAEYQYRNFKEFGIRNGLSFTHHSEVLYTKGLEIAEKLKVLDIAKKFSLTTLETREIAHAAAHAADKFRFLKTVEGLADPMEMDNYVLKQKLGIPAKFLVIKDNKIEAKIKITPEDLDGAVVIKVSKMYCSLVVKYDGFNMKLQRITVTDKVYEAK